jgi:hypothetical protein
MGFLRNPVSGNGHDRCMDLLLDDYVQDIGAQTECGAKPFAMRKRYVQTIKCGVW